LYREDIIDEFSIFVVKKVRKYHEYYLKYKIYDFEI